MKITGSYEIGNIITNPINSSAICLKSKSGAILSGFRFLKTEPNILIEKYVSKTTNKNKETKWSIIFFFGIVNSVPPIL